MSLFPIVPPGPSVVVTLSGGIASGFKFDGSTASATFKIDNDGNMYNQKNGGAYQQIESATDWVRPASAAPGSYECRYTNHSGDSVGATASEDVWHSLSSGDFFVSLSQSGVGSKDATFDLQIRRDGGSILASAQYSLSAFVNNDPF